MFEDKKEISKDDEMDKNKGRKGGRSSKFQKEIDDWERDVIIMEDEAL